MSLIAILDGILFGLSALYAFYLLLPLQPKPGEQREETVIPMTTGHNAVRL